MNIGDPPPPGVRHCFKHNDPLFLVIGILIPKEYSEWSWHEQFQDVENFVNGPLNRDLYFPKTSSRSLDWVRGVVGTGWRTGPGFMSWSSWVVLLTQMASLDRPVDKFPSSYSCLCGELHQLHLLWTCVLILLPGARYCITPHCPLFLGQHCYGPQSTAR